MKRIKDLNPNSRRYWNNSYQTPEKRADYERATGGNYDTSQRLIKVLEYVQNGQKFLDLGCGTGLLCRMVKDAYPEAEVWGTDISSQAIEDNQAERSDITYHQGYVGLHDEIVPENHFDVVFSGEVLEHLDDPIDLLKDAYRALKPGGKLIITTPCENHIQSPEHVWEFTHEDVIDLYKQAGFEVPSFVYLHDLEHLLVIFAIGRKP